jgi:hypothetical protein
VGNCSQPVSDERLQFRDFLGLCETFILVLYHILFCDSLKLKKAFLLISALLPWPLDKGSRSWCINLSSENLLKNVEEDYFTALQSPPAAV